MLVLSRKIEEEIKIGDDIFVKPISTSSNRDGKAEAKLGITAPKEVAVIRIGRGGNIQTGNLKEPEP